MADSDALSDKGQLQFRKFLGGLYMLVRSVKLYEPSNAIFQKPLHALLDTANGIVANEGKLHLSVVGNAFYGNGVPLKVDQASLSNLEHLVEEMERREVGGLNLNRPTTIEDLRNFLAIFASDEDRAVGDSGLEDKPLVAIQVARWRKLEEKLKRGGPGDTAGETKGPNEGDGGEGMGVARQKYFFTLYARAIYLMRAYVQALQKGEPPPSVSSVTKLIQDVVNVVVQGQTQLLGMSTNEASEETFLFHLVNSALVSLVFGHALGLNREQLRELGISALFSRAPLVKLPMQWVLSPEPEKAPPGMRSRLALGHHEATQLALTDFGSPRLRQFRAAVAAELPKPFGKVVAGGMVLSEDPPLIYTRIVAIAAYFDLLTGNASDRDGIAHPLALELMWNQQRHRFDPELLAIFVEAMSQQIVKEMNEGVVDIAGLH